MRFHRFSSYRRESSQVTRSIINELTYDWKCEIQLIRCVALFSLLDFGVVCAWNMSNAKSIGEETVIRFFRRPFVNLIFYCCWQYCALMFCRGTHFELYVVADLGPLTIAIHCAGERVFCDPQKWWCDHSTPRQKRKKRGENGINFYLFSTNQYANFNWQQPFDLNGDTHSVCSSMVAVWLLSCTRQTFHIPMNAFYLWSVQNKCAIQSNSALLSPSSMHILDATREILVAAIPCPNRELMAFCVLRNARQYSCALITDTKRIECEKCFSTLSLRAGRWCTIFASKNGINSTMHFTFHESISFRFIASHHPMQNDSRTFNPIIYWLNEFDGFYSYFFGFCWRTKKRSNISATNKMRTLKFEIPSFFCCSNAFRFVCSANAAAATHGFRFRFDQLIKCTIEFRRWGERCRYTCGRVRSLYFIEKCIGTSVTEAKSQTWRHFVDFFLANAMHTFN